MINHGSSEAASLRRRGADSVGEMIVLKVAEREGIDAREVQVPLYEVISPEALAHLFRGSSGRLTFDYMGYRVTVTHEHDVTIDDRDDA